MTAWERAEERSFFGEVVGVAVVLPGGGGVVWGLGGEVLGVAEGGREVEGEEGEEEGGGGGMMENKWNERESVSKER